MSDSFQETYLTSTVIMTNEQLACIGSVAVECSYLDQTTEVILWALAGMEFEQGKFFTTMMQLDKKFDLLSDLGKQKLKDEDIPEFTRIVSDCKTANNERNVIIHGIWSTNEKNFLHLLKIGPENSSGATAVKRRLRTDALEFSVDKVDSVAHKLSHARQVLYEFAQKKGFFRFP